ncbi:hypothetical protein SLEP1_g6255 [Rubroshorea leprosula]|uniref:Uncharacterized protein n=1 Tax=Rubroshorea leprosula TaxID=152421 RepID=A0AAV5HUM7_9ROSI|nr:hypothetical protein SLEP1_g6255 [Rubroshorea leprosula]
MSQLRVPPTLFHPSFPSGISTRLPRPPSLRRDYIPCQVRSMVAPDNQIIVRRTANYQPTIWGYDYIQSLRTEYVGESYTIRRNKLKEDVRLMLDKYVHKEPLYQLEFIDALERLGLSYHFEDEIKKILERVYGNNQCNYGLKKDSLYATALKFRLLRQHGYNIPQESFNKFIDENGNFKACFGEDCRGMLYLYEASFLSVEGENVLDAAKTFATKHLNEYVKCKEGKDPYLFTLVKHALEFPLHWRMLRMEARWFIEVYQKSPDMNPILLDLAKLDFNMVQAIHQEDLKDAFMWWKRTGLGEKLEFIRNRMLENFLWTIGGSFQPQYGYVRRMASQVNALITTTDDVYDVYGTLDELELFTDAIERWDINAIEHLPDYLKLCFFALHNFENQVVSDIFREQGLNILPYSKKAWLNLYKAYLIEAKWYHNGYTTTLKEYIDNAVVSISAPVILYHSYVLASNPITMEVLRYLDEEFPDIIRCSSMIFRLANDLGTSPVLDL